MANIERFPLVRHLRGTPTAHVRHLRRGKLVHDGTGQAFWFRPLAAVLSEIPVDDRELPLLFHSHTVDYQDVTVQVTLTYRIVDPAAADDRIDFAIDPDTGRWRGTPLEQLAGLLTESAQQYALEVLVRTALTEALVEGVGRVRAAITAGLATDPRLIETGLAVIGVRVMAIRPEPNLEKALQTPTREQVQQEADRATYERRALAVEREGAIGENELSNRIELARREEQLVAQEGTNARRRAEEASAADRIAVEAQAGRERSIAQARADGIRASGDARGAAETALVAAYRDLPNETLLGLAVKEFAANLPQISSLVLTPDLFTPILGRLTAATPAAAAPLLGPAGGPDPAGE